MYIVRAASDHYVIIRNDIVVERAVTAQGVHDWVAQDVAERNSPKIAAFDAAGVNIDTTVKDEARARKEVFDKEGVIDVRETKDPVPDPVVLAR